MPNDDESTSAVDSKGTLRPKDFRQVSLRPGYLRGSVELVIPTSYVFGDDGDGHLTSDRIHDLTDHLLSSLRKAPEGAFVWDESNSHFPFPKGRDWLQSQVEAYLSKRSLRSIKKPVPPREMKDYTFPEDLSQKILTIETRNGGVLYQPIFGINYDGPEGPAQHTVLTSAHDCKEYSRFKMNDEAFDLIHDPATGTTQANVDFSLRLCNGATRCLKPELRDSFIEHMSEFLNQTGEDKASKKITDAIRSSQWVERGKMGCILSREAGRHATKFIHDKGLTCADFVDYHDKAKPQEVSSVYLLSQPMTEKEMYNGARFVLDSSPALAELRPETATMIRRSIGERIEAIGSQRPADVPIAPWAQALTHAAACLSIQHARGTKAISTILARSRIPDADDDWQCSTEIELVTEAPPHRRFAIPRGSLVSGYKYTEPDRYLRVIGYMDKDKHVEGLFDRTAEKHSTYIPITKITNRE